MQTTRRIFKVIFALAAVWFLVSVFFGQGSCSNRTKMKIVNGHSMEGIVDSGDSINVLEGYYNCHEIRRGDVIVYRYGAQHNPLIKRVVAVPGDSWALEPRQDGDVALLVNGVEQQTTIGTPYRFSESRVKTLTLYPSPVPVGAYIILGNLPNGSTDSTQFGLVSGKDIIGKVVVW